MVKYLQWYGAEKRENSSSLTEAVAELKRQVPDFLLHTLVKRRQAKYFEHARDSVSNDTAIIQIDFAENYNYGEADAVQGFHWMNKQATLFTGFAWLAGKKQGYICITDCLDHTKVTVAYLTHLIIEDVLKKYPGVKNVQLFSDGAASQFKQKYTLAHFSYLQSVLNVNISWFFFATSHGKGVVDGLGGTAKRVAYNATKSGKAISNIDQLTSLVSEKMPGTEIIMVPKQSIDHTADDYMTTVKDIKSVPKCQSQHCYFGNGIEYVFRVQNFSGADATAFEHHFRDVESLVTSTESSLAVATPQLPTSQSNRETFQVMPSNFYAVAFDDIGWFVGRVDSVGTDEYEFKFMVRDGNRWRWPVKDDISKVHANFILCPVTVEPIGNGTRIRWVLSVIESSKADKLYKQYLER